MSLEQRIARLRSKRLTSELFTWPSTTHVEMTYDDEGKPHYMRVANIIRVPSNNEIVDSREKKKRDIFKCVHGYHYFTPCRGCKRTQEDADKWLKYYEEKTLKLRKQLGVVK
jgi:hypothetical protein